MPHNAANRLALSFTLANYDGKIIGNRGEIYPSAKADNVNAATRFFTIMTGCGAMCFRYQTVFLLKLRPMQ